MPGSYALCMIKNKINAADLLTCPFPYFVVVVLVVDLCFALFVHEGGICISLCSW